MVISRAMLSILKDIRDKKLISPIRKNDIENYHDVEALVDNGYLKATLLATYVNPGYFDVELTSLGYQAIESDQINISTKRKQSRWNWEVFERFMKTTKWLGWVIGTVFTGLLVFGFINL